MAQSLFTSTENITTFHANTPTGRTPSSSFSWSDRSLAGEVGGQRNSRSASIAGVQRQRQNSIDERAGYYYATEIDESDEDEQMVEDLLYPSSPMAACPSLAPTTSQFSQYAISNGASAYPSEPSSPKAHPDNHFTTSDPFYLAQLQQQREQAQTLLTSSSFFSQMGRPTQHSPFSSQAQAPSQYHYGHHQQYEVERHHPLPVMFDR